MKKVIVGPETFEWEDDDHSFGTLTAVIKVFTIDLRGDNPPLGRRYHET